MAPVATNSSLPPQIPTTETNPAEVEEEKKSALITTVEMPGSKNSNQQESDDIADDDEEDWIQQMSPRFLNQVINETTPRPSEIEQENRHNFENQQFIN